MSSRSARVLLLSTVAAMSALFMAAGAQAYRMVGIGAGDPSTLFKFSTGASSQESSPGANIGFPEGATDRELVGVAFRPGTDDLYSIGSEGTVYLLDDHDQTRPFRAFPAGPTPAVDPIPGSAAGVVVDGSTLRVLGGPDRDLAFNIFNGEPVGPARADLHYRVGSGVPEVFGGAGYPLEGTSGYPYQATYVIDAASASVERLGPDGLLEPDVSLGQAPLLPEGGLAIPGQGGLEADRAVVVIRHPGLASYDVCRVGLTYRMVERDLSEPPSVVGCRPLAFPGSIRGIAIEPYSVVSIDGPAVVREGRSEGLTATRHGNLDRTIDVPWSVHKEKGTPASLVGVHGVFHFSEGNTRGSSTVVDIPEDQKVENVRTLRIELEPGEHDDWVGESQLPTVLRIRDDDMRAGVRIPVRGIGSRKALRNGHIVLPYRCSQICSALAKLSAEGQTQDTYRGEVEETSAGNIVLGLGDQARELLKLNPRVKLGLYVRLTGDYIPGSRRPTVVRHLRLRFRP
jgi:hypothetical protein